MTRRLLIWFWNQPKETFLNVHSSTRICRGRGATAPPRQDNKYTHHLEALQPTLLFPSRRCRGPASPSPGRRAGMAGRLPRQSHTQLLATAVPPSPPGHGRAASTAGSGRGHSSPAGVRAAAFSTPITAPLPFCVCVSFHYKFHGSPLPSSQLKFCREWLKSFQSHSCSRTLRDDRSKSINERKSV